MRFSDSSSIFRTLKSYLICFYFHIHFYILNCIICVCMDKYLPVGWLSLGRLNMNVNIDIYIYTHIHKWISKIRTKTFFPLPSKIFTQVILRQGLFPKAYTNIYIHIYRQYTYTYIYYYKNSVYFSVWMKVILLGFFRIRFVKKPKKEEKFWNFYCVLP